MFTFLFTINKYKMATITTSLPDELIQKLSDYAKNLDMPKNKLIEKIGEISEAEVKQAVETLRDITTLY
jgi:predicted transcriptional regulator